MKRTIFILPRLFTPLALCLLFLRFPVFSQPSVTNQAVTLQVAELNTLSVAHHLLTIDGRVKPEIRYQASAATRLIWTSNGENRKITVKKKTSGGVLTITVEDTDGDHLFPPGGKELREDTTFDLIRNVSKAAGSCVIRFAAVSFDASGDNVMQNVIYTISSS